MANLKEISDLYPKIVPYCPGIETSTPLLLTTLRDIIIEYCVETQAWTAEMDAILVRQGVKEYDLEKPSYAEIITIKKAYLDSIEQDPTDDYTMPTREQFKFVYAPTKDTGTNDDGLEIELVLQPSDAATVVPTDLYRHHNRAWAWGTVGRLLEMPRKKWTNARMAIYFNDKYWQAVSMARIEQNRGSMNQELQARSPNAFALEGEGDLYAKNPLVW